ncbi:hypothetical protein BAE39_00015 [Mesorhizobium loti]|uniref:Probable transposase n=1 Tax=Rhizobium loti TaxID=381 RepID=M5AL91_RHILI|nr:hypothetical protein A9174_32975 [Mesorhizobium loti NZP2037]OBP78562.1 hypothetical protein BAE41_30475 [Mesorhizobium loti]OBP82026.1 hypothetical protein BAE39_00015 [Mesorhizobium loti]OBP97333.1 hypothetical protein BAE38_00025 [Mesorhizobium loti]OBQ59024.1 hypothetical protein A8145_25520 [Mesorhizobium loti]
MHFARNVLAHAGKSGRRVVSAFIATAFVQETAEAASLQWRAVADQIRPKVPNLAAIMDEAQHDVLAYMSFPREHRVKLHSTDDIDKPDFGFLAFSTPVRFFVRLQVSLFLRPGPQDFPCERVETPSRLAGAVAARRLRGFKATP